MLKVAVFVLSLVMLVGCDANQNVFAQSSKDLTLGGKNTPSRFHSTVAKYESWMKAEAIKLDAKVKAEVDKIHHKK